MSIVWHQDHDSYCFDRSHNNAYIRIAVFTKKVHILFHAGISVIWLTVFMSGNFANVFMRIGNFETVILLYYYSAKYN